MSHIVTIKSQMKNIEALTASCEALKIPFQVGPHQVTLYAGQQVKTDFSFQLPGWRYRCAVNAETGEVKMDNFGGSWGKIEEFDKLHQEYSAQVVEREPSIQEKVQEGWLLERVQQENGKIRVRCYEPTY